VLITAAKTAGGPDAIEEMDKELTKVIEDFDRAVNVEALRLAKETGKHSLSQSGDISFSVVPYVEQQLLLERLEPIKASYDLDLRCMEGTRQSILNQVMSWVSDPQEKNDATTEQYLLVLRLTRNRKNVVSSFDLCKHS
jgi:hypothetical protein